MKPTFVTFVGGWGESPVERMMASAHRAIARDTLERAGASGAFEALVLVTDSANASEDWGEGISIEPAQGPFHFGHQLRDVVHKHDIQGVVYVGGGAMPLLSAEGLARLSQQLSTAHETVITNNLYSGDLVAFTPAEALDRVTLPTTDNPLPQLLCREAGLKSVTLPREVATLLDVDTPTDLAILSIYPSTGPCLRAYLDGLGLDTSRLLRAASLLTNPQVEVLVAGRVGSYVWSRLEEETACRCRIISEERGMRADGREAEGKVRSILGHYIEQVQPRRFFEGLSELGDAAFIDTRVLFHHLNLGLSASDRFLSDLMRPQQIAHPWLRDFTQAALDAPIPVILGGHSLVSGGLLALAEVAWNTTDLVDKGRGVI
ncbi:MAG: hypothetical protein V3U26_02380 [Dehalococcoidia bacterium]